jgi:hypothetical protein
MDKVHKPIITQSRHHCSAQYALLLQAVNYKFSCPAAEIHIFIQFVPFKFGKEMLHKTINLYYFRFPLTLTLFHWYCELEIYFNRFPRNTLTFWQKQHCDLWSLRHCTLCFIKTRGTPTGGCRTAAPTAPKPKFKKHGFCRCYYIISFT